MKNVPGHCPPRPQHYGTLPFGARVLIQMPSQSRGETPPIQNIHMSYTQIWTLLIHTQTDLFSTNYHLPEKITEVHSQAKQMFPFSLFFSIWNNPDSENTHDSQKPTEGVY